VLSHRRYYVTKLRDRYLGPNLMVEDYTFEQAESDGPFRLETYLTRYAYRSATEAPSTGVWLILGVDLGTLGVLAVLGLLWRRRSRRKPEDVQEA
jgi:hypothetical protein